jgi:hypothetical protein
MNVERRFQPLVRSLEKEGWLEPHCLAEAITVDIV